MVVKKVSKELKCPNTACGRGEIRYQKASMTYYCRRCGCEFGSDGKIFFIPGVPMSVTGGKGAYNVPNKAK